MNRVDKYKKRSLILVHVFDDFPNVLLQQVHIHHEESLVFVLPHCYPSFVELYEGLQFFHCGFAVYSLHLLQLFFHQLIVAHLKHLDPRLFGSSSQVFVDDVEDAHPLVQNQVLIQYAVSIHMPKHVDQHRFRPWNQADRWGIIYVLNSLPTHPRYCQQVFAYIFFGGCSLLAIILQLQRFRWLTLFQSFSDLGLLLIALPFFQVVRVVSWLNCLIFWFLSEPVDKFFSNFLRIYSLLSWQSIFINIVHGLLHFSTLPMRVVGLVILILVADVRSQTALQIGLLSELTLLGLSILARLTRRQLSLIGLFVGLRLCLGSAQLLTLDCTKESLHSRLSQRSLLFSIFRRRWGLLQRNCTIGLRHWPSLGFSMLFTLFRLNYRFFFFLLY